MPVADLRASMASFYRQSARGKRQSVFGIDQACRCFLAHHASHCLPVGAAITEDGLRIARRVRRHATPVPEHRPPSARVPSAAAISALRAGIYKRLLRKSLETLQ